MSLEYCKKALVKLKLVLGRKNKFSVLANEMVTFMPKSRKTGNVSFMPSRLMVEPTNACMLSCPTCPTGNKSSGRPAAEMSLQTFKNIVRQAEGYVSSITMFNYGEPLLNQNLSDMISYAVSRKLWVWTSTNGILLRDVALASDIVRSGLHSLLICLDGASQETLGEFRKNAQFEDITRGIRNVMDAKKKYRFATPFVDIQFILMKHNMGEVEEIKRISAELGIHSTVIKKVGISLNEPDLIPMIDRFSTDASLKDAIYKSSNGYRFKKPHPGKCPFLYRLAVINANGDVLPCCYDLKAEYVMGNIYNDTLAGIWRGNSYQHFRRTFEENPEYIPLCAICPEGRT